jgi:signal transduction histidine kinase
MAKDDLNFQLLFESSPEVLLVVLPDAPRFTMVAATESRLAVTHTTREETIGRGLFEIFPDNPDDPNATGASNLRASLERVMATRASDTMAVQKYDIRGPDGSFQVKHWSPKNIPVLSADGDVRYILHRVEDVTELVHASEKGEELRGRTQEMEREVVARSLELAAAVRDLRAANAKLGELDAAKTAFFSNVSHEFRTPLTLMLGPLEDALADRGAPLTAVQVARLQLAHDNALRVLKLVNALLDFSRLEAGRVRLRCAPIDLAAYTAKLARMYESACEKAHLRLTIECPPLSSPIWVDRDLWEKIVPNLVSNAFKYTFEGEIAVRMRETAQDAILEVADTGTGIPESDLPLIFDRFHRVAGATGRTFEGTGIGLSLVRELAALHGGSVTVESVVGRGSTFLVTIPKGSAHLPPDAVADAPAPQTARDALALATEASRWVRTTSAVDRDQPPADPAPHRSGSRTRVLVVDDNADLRSYVAGLLAPSCAVTTAADGREALNQVRTEPPDIIVSDVMMPHLDGFGLVRELRADPRTATLPVILLSARAGEDAAVEGLGTGADDYLAKPFSARELLARVRTHAELARMRREWTAQLEAANTELEAFSYSVSHDLRAPLRHVLGFANLLAQQVDKGNTEKIRAHTQTITDAAAKMSRLIDDLLAFSRFARTPLAKGPVDLNTVVHDVRHELMGHKEATGRHIAWQIDPLPLVDADPTLMRQVLINLMSNAVKYSGRRAQARIDIGIVDGSASEIVLFVRDNGAGFDARYSDRLFGVFQRLHTAEEFEGTGIGLANVKRIVSRHGGRVWAESVLNEGATFYIALPKESP